VQVRSEPLTYDRHAPTSFFRDLVLSAKKDPGASARIARYEQEIRVLIEGNDERALRVLGRAGVESRVAPNRVPGTGGNFAVPLWLIEDFATAPRTGRVLGDLIPSFPLPHGIGSVNIPRLTTGTATAGTIDGAPVPEQDIVDAAVSSTVVTIAGEGDFPLQMLEQSPADAHLDWAIFKDLGEDADYRLEQQLLFGTGTPTAAGGQLLGVTNVTGINTVTYTDGSPTLSEMYSSFGKAGAQISDNRKKPPECWLMTGSRWFWIATSEDDQHRPITPPDTSPPPPTTSGAQAIGALAGRLPVYIDDAIPATYSGTSLTPGGGTQDLVICLRPDDLMLFESEPVMLALEEVGSGSLQVRLQLRKYVAALTGRYPSGISVVCGTGFTVQSGF
jgi:HK97 family phage major capsid protein